MIESDLQNSAVGSIVTLWQLDTRNFVGGEILYFTSSTDGSGSAIEYGSQVYVPIPMQFEGFDKNGTGANPQPKVQISNAFGSLSSSFLAGALQDQSDLVGATLTRIRTLSKHLDNGDDPSTDEKWPDELYRIARKSYHSKDYVEFELESPISQEGTTYPRRQMRQRFCPHIYRRFDVTTDDFDYSKATCPYSGAACFNKNGESVTASLDRCGKKLSDCQERYGENTPLPYWGFPGMARVR